MSSLYCKKKKKISIMRCIVSSISFRIIVNLCVLYRVVIIVCFNVCFPLFVYSNRPTKFCDNSLTTIVELVWDCFSLSPAFSAPPFSILHISCVFHSRSCSVLIVSFRIVLNADMRWRHWCCRVLSELLCVVVRGQLHVHSCIGRQSSTAVCSGKQFTLHSFYNTTALILALALYCF